MKLLINLCSYDGISTHYCGVGTIIKRYIKSIIKYCNNNNIHFDLNLYTSESFEYTLGYNADLENYHLKLPNTNLFKVSNGSNGETNFGTLDNWKTLSMNTAKLINKLDFSKYDKIITLAHDTPYCDLIKIIQRKDNHKIIWIPHSTVKIHGYSSDKKKSNYDLKKRYEYEQSAINFINQNSCFYLGACGKYIGKHMLQEYKLKPEKLLYILNGEILDEEEIRKFDKECEELFDEIKNYNELIISFGRAEKYKNLESTMYLGKEMNIKTVVIAQSYYKGQPIIEEYNKIAIENNTKLFVDVPFSLPHYILRNFNNNIILLVPSNKEIMGLVVNEVRKLNRENILIVANNIDGLKEQINDTVDGLLVDLDNIKETSVKIKKYFNNDKMKNMNNESQKTLKEKYDFYINFSNFMDSLLDINGVDL